MGLIKTEVDTDIFDFRSAMEEAMEETSGMTYKKHNDNKVWHWDNENLYPSYEYIGSRQRTKERLKNAKDNDTLDQIQQFEEPLAVGVTAIDSKFGRHDRWLTRYAFDFTRIKQLSKSGSTRRISNYREYETWSWLCHKKHISDYKSESYSNLTDRIEK